ncbi:MAG: TPM domain-containing protein, partial [Ruminococcus sp.]|nr:TPM domain-containing protein [Ruminococcus sp.]
MPAFAQSELPRLVDHADVLTDSEEADLLAQLDEVSERHQFDLVVLTVNEFGEFDAMT